MKLYGILCTMSSRDITAGLALNWIMDSIIVYYVTGFVYYSLLSAVRRNGESPDVDTQVFYLNAEYEAS